MNISPLASDLWAWTSETCGANLRQIRKDENVMSREEEFSAGGKVQIKAGPFQNFTGTIASVDQHRDLVNVKIDIFGRPAPLEFNFSEVAPAPKTGKNRPGNLSQ